MKITKGFSGPLEPAGECRWRIPRQYKRGMRVDGLIYADARLIEMIRQDPAPEQVANVAFLPGIQRASLAMPDIHWGYGFCIGGVCATDPDEGGVISPGGVGYDINCGVRLVRSNLSAEDVTPRLRPLIEGPLSRDSRRRGAGGTLSIRPQGTPPLDGRGTPRPRWPRPRHPGRHRPHRSGADASPGQSRGPSVTGPLNGAARSVARSVRGTISSKCRS